MTSGESVGELGRAGWLETIRAAVRPPTSFVGSLAKRPALALSGMFSSTIALLWTVFPPETRALVIDEWAYLKAAARMGLGAAYRPDPTAVAADLVPVTFAAVAGRLLGDELFWLRFASAASFIAMGILAYLLAARLGASAGWAVACGLAAVVNPVVMPLAVTGMSDLPASALCWATVLLGVIYFSRRSRAALAGCCVLGALSALTRPTAAVPLVVVTGLTLFDKGSGRRRFVDAATGAAGLGIVGGFLWVFSEDTASTRHYLDVAALAPLVTWAKMATLYPLHVLLYLALVAIPISAGLFFAKSCRSRLRAGAVAGGVLAFMAGVATSPGSLRFPYMSWGSVVAANGIGGGDRPPLPTWLLLAVSAVVGASLGVIGASSVSVMRASSYRLRTETARRAAVAVPPGPCLFVALAILGLLAAGAVMGLAFRDGRTGYDRYLIPLFGPAIALLSSRLSGSFRLNRIAVAVACGTIVVAVVVGVQEWHAQRRVAWAELEALTRSGVPATKIDGGFEWTAFHQPPNYVPRYADSRNVPWYIREFAPSTDREWVLSATRLEGYEVVETVRWESWLREGFLYLQRRLG